MNRIQQGKPPEVQFISRQSARVTKWRIQFEGEVLIVVYDAKRKTIVTVWREGEFQ